MKQFLVLFAPNVVHNYAWLSTMVSELENHETSIDSQM